MYEGIHVLAFLFLSSCTIIPLILTPTFFYNQPYTRHRAFMSFTSGQMPSGAPPAYEELNMQVYDHIFIGPACDKDSLKRNNIRLMIRFYAATVVMEVDRHGNSNGYVFENGKSGHLHLSHNIDYLGGFTWLCAQVRDVVLKKQNVLLYVREDENHGPDDISRAYTFEEVWRIYTRQNQSPQRLQREHELNKVLPDHMVQLQIWQDMVHSGSQEVSNALWHSWKDDLVRKGLLEPSHTVRIWQKEREKSKEWASDTEPAESSGSSRTSRHSKASQSSRDKGSSKKSESSKKQDHGFLSLFEGARKKSSGSCKKCHNCCKKSK